MSALGGKRTFSVQGEGLCQFVRQRLISRALPSFAVGRTKPTVVKLCVYSILNKRTFSPVCVGVVIPSWQGAAMRNAIYIVALISSVFGSAAVGQKATTLKKQEIFFRVPDGKGTKLVAAARDGSNVSTVYRDTGSLYFSYDVGSADSRQIAIGTRTGEIKVLTLGVNASGQFFQESVRTVLTGAAGGSDVDFSPDQSSIAYRGSGSTGNLMVLDLNTGQTLEWLRGPWAWDFVWARNGGSIIVLEQNSPADGRSHLYELTSPNQPVEILNSRYMDRVDISRLDPSVLLLSYNSEDGAQTFVGTWRLPITNSDGSTTSGTWINPSLAGRAVSSRGVFSCNDTFLMYGGAGPAGRQLWFTRDLPSGADIQVSGAAANAVVTSWSKCPSPPTSSSAFDFREVPR